MKIFSHYFNPMKGLLALAAGCTYYLAVPAEHQIFKAIVLAALVVALCLICKQEGKEYSRKEKSDADQN